MTRTNPKSPKAKKPENVSNNSASLMNKSKSNKVVRSTARKPPNAGRGRKAGVPNKTTALLKDAILQATAAAGGKDGLVGYLTAQAKRSLKSNPAPYMGLLGRVMPLQISGDPENPLVSHHVVQVEFVAAKDVRPQLKEMHDGFTSHA
jgi:hypothetical protein